METITEKPYCHVLAPEHKEFRCDQCFACSMRDDVNLKICTRCRVVRYCSGQCQKEAWKLHKSECTSLKRVAPKIPTESVLLLNRLLILRKLGEHTVIHNTAFGKRTFEDLMSHKEDIVLDKARSEHLVQVVTTLKIFIGNQKQSDLPEPRLIVHLFGRMCINSFTVCDGEMRPLGVAIYLGASKMDHSCRLNAVASFEGINLRLTKLSPSLPTDQLKISYIDIMCSREERQRQLSEQYYFQCECEMCQDEALEAEMCAVKCQQVNCEGILVSNHDTFSACRKCNKSPVNGKELLHRKEAAQQQVAKVIEKERSKNNKEHEVILCACRSCIDVCKPLLSLTNVYLVRIYDRAFDSCIQLKLWDEALHYGLQTLPGFRKYYHKFHPQLGVQLLKVAKLQLYLQQLTEAHRHLILAEEVLRVSHGTDHPLYGELTTLTAQCQEQRRVALEQSAGDT